MKLALPAHTTPATHLQLPARSREWLFALCCTLIPYAVAAIGVFAYHEQWFM